MRLAPVATATVLLAGLVALGSASPTDPRGALAGDGTQRHTGGASSAMPTTTPTPTKPAGLAIDFTAPTDPNPTALSRFYGQHPHWSTCAESVHECATVRVPVDYAEPGGTTIEVALRKVAARHPAQRRGTLFVNPGGPGGSGLEFAQYADEYFGADVLDVWDVVGFDPRGMGESAAVDCLTPSDLDAVNGADPTPETTQEAAALRAAATKRLQGCQARGGALATHMGTENVIRDLDILRDSVGDQRLNYLGVSYGTLIGSMYADEFTSRVGLMVLDSAVSPDGFGYAGDPNQADYDESARASAEAFEAAFNAFARQCIDDGSCALGADVAAVRATVTRFVDGLEKRPLPTEFDTLPTLTEGWAATAISNGLDHSDEWDPLVEALDSSIHQGDGSDLAYVAMVEVGRLEDGSYPGTSFVKSHLPVTCADWPTTGWQGLDVSPSVLRDFPIWARLGHTAGNDCAGWGGPIRQNLLVGSEPATPVLVIGNESDPVTPIEDTADVAALIVRSRLVTVDAEGHGAYSAGNTCIDKVVEDYLARSVVAPPDTHCHVE